MISYTHDKISCLLPADSEKLPVCFQTVSGQKNNADGKEWRVISESDFASGFVFTPVLQMPEKVTLTLEDNTDTHKVSPCLFQLTHTYTVSDSGFAAKYTLYNRDKSPAAYRLDSEPVFCLPLPEGTTANEYRLEISAVDAVLTAEND
ncbi:MAG: hypothetical protein IJ325_00030 [Clostridia bacterium]|nr:hypothetical protein [Clostridia bacterium]